MSKGVEVHTIKPDRHFGENYKTLKQIISYLLITTHRSHLASGFLIGGQCVFLVIIIIFTNQQTGKNHFHLIIIIIKVMLCRRGHTI